MSNQNVIVVSAGWFDGLPHHVRSIREYSPRTIIHLLHDGTNQEKCSSIAFDHSDNLLNYGEGFSRFSKEYRWCGSNTLEFELNCYRRHYAIHEYCVSRGIKTCWYFDWDVLVFCDLESEAKRLWMWRGMRCQGNNFINDMEFFGEYLKSWICHPLISNPNSPNSDQHLELEIRIAGGFGNHYIDSLVPQEDGSSYDGNLCLGDHGFAVNKGSERRDSMKWLMWVRCDGGKAYPHGFFEPTRRWVRLKTLHCWGSHKKRMGEYLELATAKRGCETTPSFVG